MDEGHCGLPTDELVPLAEKLLEVPVELVRTALDLELAEGIVIADSVGKTRCVFPAGLHRAERRHRRTAAAAYECCAPLALDRSGHGTAMGRGTYVGLTLAESQRTAIRLALKSKVLILTGGTGSAKPRSSRVFSHPPPRG